MDPRRPPFGVPGTPTSKRDENEGRNRIDTGSFRPLEPVFDPLPKLQPPSEEEAMFYYYGLPSRPRLIGRTSSGEQIWETIEEQKQRQHRDHASGAVPYSAWFYAQSPTLGPIGRHAIRERWHSGVSQEFVSCLEPLQWTSVDVVRMSMDDKSTCSYKGQVVVWVGVAHANNNWDTVASVLRAGRRVLDAAGLSDVEIQLRESKVVSFGPGDASSSSSSSPSNPLLPPFRDWVLGGPRTADFLFTTTLGRPLFPASKPTTEGALGLYLWPASNPGSCPTWALTCRHVGMPDQPNVAFYDVSTAASRSASHGIGIAEQSRADGHINHMLQSKDLMASHLRADIEADEKISLELKLARMTQLVQAALPFRDAKARMIGRVIYSPPIGAVKVPSPPISVWTRDICVVQLDKNKFSRGPTTSLFLSTQWPANLVDLRAYDQLNLTKLLNSFPQCPPHPNSARPNARPIRFVWSENGLLKLSGVIPLRELCSPPGPTTNAMDDNCLVVGKYGPMTDLTWGWASEVLSITRNSVGKESFESKEWAIHGIKTSVLDNGTFSAPGDSGSAVFGIDGRLGGFVTRGTESKPDVCRGIDITYATPAAFVLEDIEKALGVKVAF